MRKLRHQIISLSRKTRWKRYLRWDHNCQTGRGEEPDYKNAENIRLERILLQLAELCLKKKNRLIGFVYISLCICSR